MFTAEDVPPMSFWEAAVSGPDGLSARDFHKIATQYCAVAAKSSAHSAWKGMLQRGRHTQALAGAADGNDDTK